MSKLSAKYSTFEEFNLGFQDGIVCIQTGVNGFVLSKKWNRVITVAINNQSAVKLPQPKYGLSVYVFNDSVNTLAVTTWSNTIHAAAVFAGACSKFEVINPAANKWLVTQVQGTAMMAE